MSKISCCQCGKVAVYQVKGNPLCLDCVYKVEQINYMKQIQYMQEINYLNAEMEALIGLPGISPRYEIPKPPTILQSQGKITFNNINVNKSVIGAINTGNIGQIDIALNNIKNSGDEDTAKIIKEFTEGIMNEKELNNQLKNAIIEQLSFLASQAALPKDGQKKSIIQPILKTIGESIKHIATLVNLFEALRDIFGS